MSFQIVTEPIDRWPLPETSPRTVPQFKAKHEDTLGLLRAELEWLGCAGVAVIQVVTRNGAVDLRRDGALRQDARIEHPGVRLSFESEHGPLTYATDTYSTSWQGRPAWQSNLRAIALSLQALRAVNRYGVSKSGEQYAGWQALGDQPAKLTVPQAWEVLRTHAGAGAEVVDAPRLYREAKASTHPDRNGGMRGPWDDVERAAKVLELT